MRFSKRIGLGISFLALLAVGWFVFATPKMALAAAPDFKFKWDDDKGSSFTGTLNKTSVTFKLDGSESGQWVYTDRSIPADLVSACGLSKIFVNTGDASSSKATTGDIYYLHYKLSKSGSCTAYPGAEVSISGSKGQPPPTLNITWAGAKGVLNSDGSQIEVTFSDGSSYTFFDNNIGDKKDNFKPKQPDSPPAKIGGISLDKWFGDTAFGSGKVKYGLTLSSYKATKATVDVQYFVTGHVNYIEDGSNGKLTIPVDVSNYVPPVAGGPVTDNSCEASYTGAAKEFNWLFCAALRGIDSMVNWFEGQIESNLFLCTGTSDTTGQTCNGNILTNNSSAGGVYQVWAVFRIIATSLLVIIMLVMVLAQASGGFGPLDAYTVRKALPRLVVAAIFLQISWFVFKYAIDLSNDVGKGIADLMFAPFGGNGKFALDNLVGGTGKFAPGGTISAGAITAGALVLFSGLTAIGWFIMGLSLVASVFTGYLLLIVRRMLVILCMMVVPLALVAWILPGTKKYWDMWKDNFTKLLMMFPMIMAMIAGGRIFAYIGSQQGGFTGLIIVLVGVFGPYFYLPKTFKWGGQAFGALANATWQGTQRYRQAPQKYALGRAKEEREWRANQRRIRLGENTSAHPRFDRLLSGGYNFARGRQHREQLMNAERAKGRKAVDEEAQNALVGSEYERLDHPQKLDTLRTVAQGAHDARTGLDGHNRALQRWAMDQLATFGDWDIISELRDRNQVDERTWQMFVAKNIGGIHQNAPHLSPQRTDLSALGYEDFTQWKDLEFSEYRRQFRNGQDRDVMTGQLVGSPDATAKRLRMYTKARQALDDNQVRRRLSAAAIAELEGIVNDVDTSQVQIDSPTVSVSESARGGVRGTVFLPANMDTPEARLSLRQQLTGPEGQRVAGALANRVADSPVGSPDEQAFRDILNDIRDQAIDAVTGAVVNEVARDQYNQLLQAYNDRLAQRIDDAQGQSFQVGHDAATAGAEMSAEITHQTDKTNSLGLTPLP